MSIIPVLAEILDLMPGSIKYLLFLGIISLDIIIPIGLMGLEDGIIGSILSLALSIAFGFEIEIKTFQLLVFLTVIPVFYFILRKST